MSEVFGSENHVATIPYRTGNNPGRYLTRIGNWLIWYARNESVMKYRQLHEKHTLDYYIKNWPINRGEGSIQTPDGSRRNLTPDEIANPNLIPNGDRMYGFRVCVSSSWSETGRSDTFYWHESDAPCDTHPNAWDGHECSEVCNAAENNRLPKPNNNRACPKGRRCGPNCQANSYPCPPDRHWSVSPNPPKGACERPPEEVKGCTFESEIMVLNQKTCHRKGAPNRCYHVTTLTASKSPSTIPAW